MDSSKGGDFEAGGEELESGGSAGYTAKDLQAEIAKKIEWLESNNGKVLHPDYIAIQVISDHPDIDGHDTPFYTCCTRTNVRDEVRRQLNRFKVRPDVDKQLVLEGFERLQKRYLVERDDEQVAVRVEECTDDELLAKANEYGAMGDGCYQHRDEILRYLKLRRRSGVVGSWMPLPEPPQGAQR